MGAAYVEELDELVRAICADHSRTLDDFLAAAREKRLFNSLNEVDAPQFVRSVRPGPQGDLFASSVLRILAARREAIDHSTLRTSVADWLDANYNRQLAAVYSRPKARNAYELLNGFAPVAQALELKATECIAALKTLTGVEQLRQDLLRLLNSAAGRVMLRPWLPVEALGDPLAELFQAAIDLRGADDRGDVGTAYRRLGASCSQLNDILDHQPTQYATAILAGTTDAVQAAARRKLELKSPPAQLEVSVSARPLPLLEAGVTVAVALTVANVGDASAQEVVLDGSAETDGIRVIDGPLHLGVLQPQTQQSARLDILVESPIAEATLSLSTRWTNVDHTIGVSRDIGELYAHEVHINWAQLEKAEPFANYPVERERDLVGRSRQLGALRNAYGQAPLANQYVTGQRRVGKTSLVRVLTSELTAAHPSLLIATVEMGEVRSAEGKETIGNLGRKLAQRVVRNADLTGEVVIPDFSNSLAPLTDVVEQLLEWEESLSFLFVIDEFDELPHETYRRDGAGDALFIPMRSLAQKPNVGWLLVGGEKMPFIRDEQATRLNNFREMSLDYLALHEDGAGHSTDFADLVRRPLPEGFVIDDAAVRSIYDASAGNPHFAKELCATLFPRSVARRDALVTASEIQAATLAAARERDVELFAHFWEDGIFDIENERRRAELDRRSYLMAVAQLLRSGTPTSIDRVKSSAAERGLDSAQIERLQNEFVRRGILEERGQNLAVHVPLFRVWLESEGVYKLPPRGLTEKIGHQARSEHDALKVSNGEIRRLIQHWDRFRFRGDRVSREAVDDWLDQFATLAEKRLAFRLLERLHVLTDSEIFDGLRRLHRQVASARTVHIRRGQRRLTHLLVSAVGGSGSSGEAFAYKYRQANNISQNNVVSPERIIDRLLARPDITTVILIDDYIGSGKTARKAVSLLAQRSGELRARSEVQFFLFAVAGQIDSAERVAESSSAVELGLQVELAHPLMEADAPLSPRGTVFTEDERASAERMLKKYGRGLAPWPMGFGDQCALVVLPENCPNNAPPILWSSNDGWRPLFRRTTRAG